MSRFFLVLVFLVGLSSLSFGQRRKAVDSVLVSIGLEAQSQEIEMAKNFWKAYYNLPVQLKMFGFKGNNQKHLYRTFDMQYNPETEKWEATVPWGFFELHVKSMGFKDILFPMRIKGDFEDNFKLEVDTLSYTYKNRKKYNYIAGTLNFNESIIVAFKDGDYASNRAFLDEALAIEGMEHINVRRAYKIRGRNAFVVTLDIWDTRELPVILYEKIKEIPETERGYVIANDVNRAITAYQKSSNVLFANPSFLNDPGQVFRDSEKYGKSERLEYKLQTMMEQDEQTLRKINYIIKKTTPEEKEEEE